MIQRRQFLLFSSFLGMASCLKAKELSQFEKDFIQVETIIEAVQEHMFPQKSKIPSAKEMKSTQFLFATVAHKSFDKDIRAFVLEGAKELRDRENGRFVSMTHKEKEEALRAYENTNYGSAWLSRIMTLTMEGMFGDSIYGSNIKEEGWKALQSYGGKPRPTKRYLAS